MNTHKLIYPVAVMGFLVILAGCAKPPDSEVTAAKNAIEDSRNAGGADYAAEGFKGAEDAFQKAGEAIKAQEGKFALARNYDKAKELLTKAKTEAEKAKTDAAAGKEKAKGEAEVAQKEAQIALNEAKASLAKAPKGKGTKADLDAMEGDLKAAEQSLLEAQAALDKQDYLGAKAKAQSVKDKAAAVTGQVRQAMEKTGKGKK
jgi:hypothetical protein